MKYLIVSDIHGSSLYFEKVLVQYEKMHCDKMIILGDLLYHGPRNDLPNGFNVKKLIELLNSKKDEIIAIKGNCDAEVDEMVLSFPLHKEITININNKTYYLCHGHKLDKTNIFNNIDVVLYGHYHVPSFEVINNVVFFSPGSISIPKNGSDHSFSILENNVLSLFTSDGELINNYSI